MLRKKSLRAARSAEDVAVQLAGLGFAAADVGEALAAVSVAGPAGGGALEACLDWLCMHVPEADLPPAFGPGASQASDGSEHPHALCWSCLETYL